MKLQQIAQPPQWFFGRFTSMCKRIFHEMPASASSAASTFGP